ncbi:MAG: hypothetical protein ACKVS5_03820 [Parvularculaceae bacterium]
MKASPPEADIAYWSKMSFWTIEQATVLLIGADPDAILDANSLAAGCAPGIKTAYSKMFRLLDSHIRLSGIGFSQSPTEIIEWALHAKVDPPDALVDAVRAQGRTLIEERARRDDKRAGASAAGDDVKPLGERERNTLLRMIIGMAIRGYSYDPDAKRSEVPKEIADDLGALGLDCSDQTVREKLKGAREHLPSNWRERNSGNAN